MNQAFQNEYVSQLEAENDALKATNKSLRETLDIISLDLCIGAGTETTTPEQYYQRIDEGIQALIAGAVQRVGDANRTLRIDNAKMVLVLKQVESAIAAMFIGITMHNERKIDRFTPIEGPVVDALKIAGQTTTIVLNEAGRD